MATAWLSNNPGKRWTERFVLVYSLVWIGVVVLVQVSRCFARWGDPGHMALGIGLALPLWLVPLFRAAPGDAGRPMVERYVTVFNVWIFLFAFLQVYFGSQLFFDVLGMEYHFHVHWIVNRTPLFLYFMTVAYFSTYYVVTGILWRAYRTSFPGAPAVVNWSVRALLAYAVAFAETFGMANDLLREYFFYHDKSFVLRYGSLCYGFLFFVSFPLVHELGEDPRRPLPALRRIAWDVLAANTLVLVGYAICGALIGRPH
jgi:cycloeucalenol cycloisomerase